MELSTTERKVIDQVARGYGIKQIADRLCRSPYTIDTHIKNVKRKNGLNNIADIVREFIRSLDEPEEWYKTLLVLFFVAIQSLIIFGFSTDNFIITRSINRTVKTVRTQTGRKPQYYG